MENGGPKQTITVSIGLALMKNAHHHEMCDKTTSFFIFHIDAHHRLTTRRATQPLVSQILCL